MREIDIYAFRFIPASKAVIGNDPQTSSMSSDTPCTSTKASTESMRGSTAGQSPGPHEGSSVNDETPPLPELHMQVERPEVQRDSHNQGAEQLQPEPMEHSVLVDDSIEDKSMNIELAASSISTPELITSSNSDTSSNLSIIDLTQD